MVCYLIRYKDNIAFTYLTEENISFAGKKNHTKLLIDNIDNIPPRRVCWSRYKNGRQHTTSTCMENNANLKVK
jgi:hypothetical protein